MFDTLKNQKHKQQGFTKNKTGIKKSYKNTSGLFYKDTQIYQNKYASKNDDFLMKSNNSRILNVGMFAQTKPIVQMYQPKDKTFENKEIEWDDENERIRFWTTVDAGMEQAIVQLEKVRQQGGRLGVYATYVMAILKSDSLEIFPMTIEGIAGLSSFANLQISLNVNELNGKVDEMAKTLIHEAFHIYGGCWKINPDNGSLEYNEELDTVCDSTNIAEIYSELIGKQKLNIRADAFAQYVMLA